MKNHAKKSSKTSNGITLIALVITIIVLLILAGISISMLSGDNSILQKATDAKEMKDKSKIVEQARLDILAKLADKKGTDLTQEEIKTILETYFTSESIPTELLDLTHNLISKDGGYTIKLSEVLNGVTIGTGGGDENPTGPNGKPLINQTTIAEITETKIVGEDKFGNQVVIPEGFKLAQGENCSGDCVRDGIVIEDSEGNQYVWIPVSNINHDGSNKIKINSVTEEGVEITLGRYTFDTSSPGNPTLEENSYQYANTYSTTKMIERYYSEVTTVIETSIATARGVKVNNIWNGIQGFIESVEENKGYYIARYEASYRSNGKAGSIPSTSSDTKLSSTSAPSSRTVGDLWNYITQVDAAMACRDLYTTVNSDLMNSYAWDTAIIYIQAMGNTNYSNANRGSNTTLLNTGTTGDEKCKIFDMSANEYEWTTEESQQTSRTGRYPIVYRGGCFEEWANNKGTSSRSCTQSSYCNNDFSFRASLYL